MLAALRSSRALRLLIISELVSRAGTAASFVAVWAVGAYEFGVGPMGMSLLAICNTLPRILTSHIAGRLVDRHGPRVVLMGANAIGLVGSLLQFASPTPIMLGLASVVAGAGFGAFMPAIGSMSPRVVDEEHLLPTNAMLELCWQIGFIVGPLVGALTIAAAGSRAPLLFDAATFAVAIVCIIPLHLRPLPTAAPAADPAESEGTGARDEGGGFVRGLRYTWGLPIARFVLLLNTGSWLGISFFIVLEPLFVEHVLGASPAVLGYLQTSFGVGAVIGAVVAARAEDRVGPARLAATIGVCGVGMIVYTATTSIAVSAAGVGLWGIGIGLWAPFARTMIHRGVPIVHHGRVNGVMSSLQSTLEVLPVLAAGPLALWVGIQPTLIASGVGSLVLAGWGRAVAGRVEREQAEWLLTDELEHPEDHLEDPDERARVLAEEEAALPPMTGDLPSAFG